MTAIGAMLRRELPPEAVLEHARALESGGFDELWVVEDCFWSGGVATAAAVLAATQRVRVGIGILPAVARNPAITAMELAALARLFPGRLIAGIGHGVTGWMEQIGALPASQLAALGETVAVLRVLLRGGEVSRDGDHVHLSGVQLVFPPYPVPPVLVGAVGPRSVELAGRVSDGMILPENSSPAYVADIRARLGPDAQLVVYVWSGSAEDLAASGEPAADPGPARAPFMDPAASVVASPTEPGPVIDTYVAAGATSVVLVPPPTRPDLLLLRPAGLAQSP